MNSMQIKRWLVLSLLLWFSFSISGCSSLTPESAQSRSGQAIEQPTSDHTAVTADQTESTVPNTDSAKRDSKPGPSDGTTTQSASPSKTLAELIEDLKTTVMLESGIPDADLLVQEAEAVQWSDSCLGAPRPDEVCAQVITPGYRIVLSDLTTTFEFHTDRTGRLIRQVRPQFPD